ncbi:MAG TPA: cytosine deaminase, partial [Methylomirabilota bacterium]|nr:cytosine deaminase [Methylomirabilota bacterium]
MATPFDTLSPSATAFVVANARVPSAVLDGPAGLRADEEGLVGVDIAVAGGRIASIHPGGSVPPDGRALVDVDRGIVLPLFVDMHTHLDKGHIWPRRPNPDGAFMSALEAVRDDRDEGCWTAVDVARRMDFSLRAAFAHGTRAIRTHIDSIPPQEEISWPVFERARAEWAGRIDLQAVSLVGPDTMLDRTLLDRVAARVAAAGGVFGGAIAVFPGARQAIANTVAAAMAHGLDLDVHVDETEDPGSRALLDLAEEVISQRFPGRVVAGHCCALAVQDGAMQDRTLDAVAEAGMAVVSLPMCNMYLQDRHRAGPDVSLGAPARTPRWRGVTLLHEMRARGIAVAVASDNTRDPFYAYGDLDGIEVMREATRILHLDHPRGDWAGMMSRMPADIVGAPDRGRLGPGLAADFVAVRARTHTELHARPQSDRVVVRDGRVT